MILTSLNKTNRKFYELPVSQCENTSEYNIMLKDINVHNQTCMHETAAAKFKMSDFLWI